MITKNSLTTRAAVLLSGAVLVPAILALSGALTGCADNQPAAEPLRVGVTPNYPPLVFMQNGKIAGAEVDLANRLGVRLGRPVVFVSLPWDKLIPALLDKRIDIIMSGMSVTEARQLRIAFCDPYLHNQLRAIFTRGDADRYKTVADVTNTLARIGFVPGTTADAFVKEHCLTAAHVSIASRGDVAFYLLQGRLIDLYIDDTFALAQIISANEAGLTLLKEPLAADDLAWAVRPDNTGLLMKANELLAQWKSDGTLNATLVQWMPYLPKYESFQQNPTGP
jgi:polar amino acid transport system substrate-binding protein